MFRELKKIFTNGPMLTTPDLDKKMRIEVDADRDQAEKRSW